MTHTGRAFPHPVYEQYVLQPFFRDALTYYYQPILAANKAHAVMLYRSGIIDHANARALLDALHAIETDEQGATAYQSGVEDLFFVIENALIKAAGPAYGGNLQLGRSRNDLGYALTRLAIRPLQLDTIRALLDLRAIILAFARQHLATLMPGYTHTQPAQPTTMAHYMAGVLAFLERDTRRMWFAYATNNASPLGAAALTGTGFPVDRDLSAALLGFDAVMASTYDSIGASDNLTDVAGALSSLAVNLSRFTHDMLFWATQESGAIRLDDSFIQISSIMPQKRNPVVLEHIRARASRMLAQAQGIIVQCHNIPFGDTQDIEDEIFPLLFGSLETSVEILRLYGAVIETLHVNVEHLRQRAIAGFTTVTELADTLVREAGLPFRQAHSIVSAMVTHALAHDLAPGDLTGDLLARISQEKIGHAVQLSDAALREALDPAAFVHKRSGYGGAAPAATAAVLDQIEAQLAADRDTYDRAVARLEQAAHTLQREIDAITAG
ncbi:MAG: argininosuccinate lyase [Chloroflexi bacterium]|nr:argininosuccinate lyase [Chloroflexota bacterium]